MTSNEAWFREFEREESLRMERVEIAAERAREHRAQYGVQDRPHPDAPPFLPGDLIVPHRNPESGAVTVSVIVDKGQGWRVGYTGPLGVVGSAPAERFVKAPVGWVDAPLMPVGHARYGLSEADRLDALSQDETDPDLQGALRRWRAAMIAWGEVWLPAIKKARGR